MNADDIELIQQSFLRLRRDADTVALLFYEHLFTEHPSLKPLFRINMMEQGCKLMNLLGVVVVGLPQFDDMKPMLRQLGARHAGYGVHEADYGAVADALLWTLELCLREHFTPPVRQAWIQALQDISSVMRSGARAAASAPAA